MKTYTKTIKAPRLVIKYDECARDPREFEPSLGYFITSEPGRNSPDQRDELEKIVKEVGDEAKNLAEHQQIIKDKTYHNLDERVLVNQCHWALNRALKIATLLVIN